MDADISEEVLSTLRRIAHSVELHSKVLHREYGLTGSQLAILRAVFRVGHLSVTDIARRVSLSQATVTSVLDRLEQQGFVVRSRGVDDKRVVYIGLTEKGSLILENNPSPLRTEFLTRFRLLADWEQTLLLSSLQRIALLMDGGTESPGDPAHGSDRTGYGAVPGESLGGVGQGRPRTPVQDGEGSVEQC